MGRGVRRQSAKAFKATRAASSTSAGVESGVSAGPAGGGIMHGQVLGGGRQLPPAADIIHQFFGLTHFYILRPGAVGGSGDIFGPQTKCIH